MKSRKDRDCISLTRYLNTHREFDDLEGAKITDPSIVELVRRLRGDGEWRVFPGGGGTFRFGRKKFPEKRGK